jgi:hypothetical protein
VSGEKLCAAVHKTAGSGSHVEDGVGEEGTAPSQVGGQLRVHLWGQRLGREGHLGHSVGQRKINRQGGTLACPFSERPPCPEPGLLERLLGTEFER